MELDGMWALSSNEPNMISKHSNTIILHVDVLNLNSSEDDQVKELCCIYKMIQLAKIVAVVEKTNFIL